MNPPTGERLGSAAPRLKGYRRRGGLAAAVAKGMKTVAIAWGSPFLLSCLTYMFASVTYATELGTEATTFEAANE